MGTPIQPTGQPPLGVPVGAPAGGAPPAGPGTHDTVSPNIPLGPGGALITTAKGTILKYSSVATPPAFANISQVRSITGPTVKPKIVDVTTHDTPGYWARKMTVLIEGGDISFEMNWSPADATHAFSSGLWSSMTQLGIGAMSMQFPNGFGTMIFKGYVSQHEFSVPVDNVLSTKIQWAITDDIRTSLP